MEELPRPDAKRHFLTIIFQTPLLAALAFVATLTFAPPAGADCSSIREPRLAQELNYLLSYLPANTAVAFYDRQTETSCEFFPDRSFESASAIKATILAGLLLKAQEEGRELRDYVVDDTIRAFIDEAIRTVGDDPHNEFLNLVNDPNRHISLHDIAELMIRASNNRAARTIYRYLGAENGWTKTFKDRVGMNKTVLKSPFGESSINAPDQVRFLKTITAENSVLQWKYRQVALDFMANASPKWGFVNNQQPVNNPNPPEGATVHVKTGSASAILDNESCNFFSCNVRVHTVGSVDGIGVNERMYNYMFAILTDKNRVDTDGIDKINFVASSIHLAMRYVGKFPETRCTETKDSAGLVFGNLCATPSYGGYTAQFTTLNNGPNRCGLFDFNLVSRTGTRVGDKGPFDACTAAPQTSTYFFETGQMGGCATLYLYRRSGDEFGVTEWFTPSTVDQPCSMPAIGNSGGGPGGGPAPVPDTTPPTSGAVAIPANANGWHKADLTIQFAAVDEGPGATGVRAIYVTLTGAQNGTTVIPGPKGSVTITAEGTTQVSYYAVDNAGNTESAKGLTIRLDETPPVISGLPQVGCTLWPPNHKLTEVATVSASDTLSGMATFDVSAGSNEPAGNHGPVTVVAGTALQPRIVQLRSERSGQGSGRVYTISATAKDLADNTATATATCTVPHDQGH